MRITFLGNGDSMGTPRTYCDCDVCEEARAGGRNRRLRSSVLLEEDGEAPLLLDCGPDWRTQMETAAIRHTAQALVTHAHFDHIGGVPEWADACRWLGKTGALYAPREVLGEVRSRFPWIERQLDMRENDAGVAYGPWRIRPWRVNHGKNGYSYAYSFEHSVSRKKWAYCSDAIRLTDEQKAPLHGLDLLVLGTSFAAEPYPMESRSVYDVKEGLALVAETKPGRVLFTHLSHDIDVRRDYGLPVGAAFAAAGMKLDV